MSSLRMFRKTILPASIALMGFTLAYAQVDPSSNQNADFSAHSSWHGGEIGRAHV